ncbi:hypothetical protein [Streptomyces sp. NBC_01435]|uniref:hypothetical protein n=1 Tax=Streptomyces sp. NBC_01435 TaxID=2903865 RepID=UPI002E30096C|nr:hypothetical protein [Streptomyces sp. NBC_01435]
MLDPTVVGVLAAAFGGARALAAGAVSFLVSAVSLFLIQTPEPKPARLEGPRPSFRQDMGEGLGFVLHHPVLRRIVACTGTVNLFAHVALAMEMPFLIRVLGHSPGRAGLAPLPCPRFSVTDSGSRSFPEAWEAASANAVTPATTSDGGEGHGVRICAVSGRVHRQAREKGVCPPPGRAGG